MFKYFDCFLLVLLNSSSTSLHDMTNSSQVSTKNESSSGNLVIFFAFCYLVREPATLKERQMNTQIRTLFFIKNSTRAMMQYTFH